MVLILLKLICEKLKKWRQLCRHFIISQEIISPPGDRTAAERNYVIEATRCRRRILQAGVLLTLQWIEVQLIFDILETNMEKSCTITIVEKESNI